MTRQEFLEEVTDVDSLYTFCCNYNFYEYTDELYSSDSYDEYLDDYYRCRIGEIRWTELKEEMDSENDPYEHDWWYRDDYYDFRPADDEWFRGKRDELLDELIDSDFFDDEIEEDDDEDDFDFEVEEAAVFLLITTV